MKYNFITGKLLDVMDDAIETMPYRANKNIIAGKDIAATAEGMMAKQVMDFRQVGSDVWLVREDKSECYHAYYGYENAISAGATTLSVGSQVFGRYDVGSGEIMLSTVKDMLSRRRASSVVVNAPICTLLSSLDQYGILSSTGAGGIEKKSNQICLSDIQPLFEDYGHFSRGCYSTDDEYELDFDYGYAPHEVYIPSIYKSSELDDNGIQQYTQVPGFVASISGSYQNSQYPNAWVGTKLKVANGIESNYSFSYSGKAKTIYAHRESVSAFYRPDYVLGKIQLYAAQPVCAFVSYYLTCDSSYLCADNKSYEEERKQSGWVVVPASVVKSKNKLKVFKTTFDDDADIDYYKTAPDLEGECYDIVLENGIFIPALSVTDETGSMYSSAVSQHARDFSGNGFYRLGLTNFMFHVVYRYSAN